jgi:hypothetical protein
MIRLNRNVVVVKLYQSGITYYHHFYLYDGYELY